MKMFRKIVHAADDDDTGNGVGDGDQRGVQGGVHLRDGEMTDQRWQEEVAKMVEILLGEEDTEREGRGKAQGDCHGVLVLVEEIEDDVHVTLHNLLRKLLRLGL